MTTWGSLRVRLTVVFGVLFFAAGAAVLAGAVILVQNSMSYSLNIAFSSSPSMMDRIGTEAVIMSTMRSNLLGKGGLTVLVVGLVATSIGWIVSGRLLGPLNRIAAIAQGIAGRTLHRRIGLEGPPSEVKTVADSFDAMLDRLDQAFAGQSRFISNAAHELKTPLALNRTLVEVAMMRPGCPPEVRQLGENLLAVNARHERLIDSLLTLARAEEAVTDRVGLDLAQVASVVADRYADDAAAAGLEVRRVLGEAVLAGDPVLLEQVLRNLLDNAVRYNQPGGWVEVRTGRSPGGVEVTVTNTGAVISPYEIPVLFEPFRRLADRVGSASGSGLGLSIVRAVSRAHGGDVEARPRPGGGLAVRVSLPATWTPVVGRPVLSGRPGS